MDIVCWSGSCLDYDQFVLAEDLSLSLSGGHISEMDPSRSYVSGLKSHKSLLLKFEVSPSSCPHSLPGWSLC